MNAKASKNGRDDGLYFLPLGGAGEIGMNLNLYGYKGRWLMVDLGISFGDETTPGIDVILPDPGYIVDRVDQLDGLVLTHAHEDHIGAVPYLWRQLRCPLYATPFTAAVLRNKLAEHGLDGEAKVTVVPLGGRFNVGPFDLELITLTHSIPEPSALAIRTEHGVVLHTGDWKLDPSPVIGTPPDLDALRRIGDEGVIAMMCDSTNVFSAGTSGSEAEVGASLAELFKTFDQRIAITCFATNVARLKSVAAAAEANDRQVGLVGRSLLRMTEAARQTGYLEGVPKFLRDDEIGYVPRDKIVLLCTGSQGEPRSALARIAADDHPEIVLEPGDVAIFSSKEIPGNEKAIGKVQNNLAKLGVRVLTSDEAFVHVSGHPNQDELAQLYSLVRPKQVIPVHGEWRHLQKHAKLALGWGAEHTVVPENGTMIRLAPGPAEIVDNVQAGRLALDGNRIVSRDGNVVRGRVRLMTNGAIVATVVVDQRGRLVAPPMVTLLGLSEEGDDDPLLQLVEDCAEEALRALGNAARQDDAAVVEAVRQAIRRSTRNQFGKKPVTEVHLVRV